MVTASCLLPIVSIALNPPPASAFAPPRPRRRRGGPAPGRGLSPRPAAPAGGDRGRGAAPPARPPDRGSPSRAPGAFEVITTGVGKTASAFVSASFFVLLACRRDAVVLTIWIGAILNAVFGKVAKRVLDQERPAELLTGDRARLKPSDGGMPSSHAMSCAFISTSLLGGVVPPESSLGAGLAMAVYCAIALRYRVRDHLHTKPQIAAGFVMGVGNALAWLRFGVGSGGDGPVLSWVADNFVSAETGLFPYSALAVPIVVGILVVGSFERRIGEWKKNRGKED